MKAAISAAAAVILVCVIGPAIAAPIAALVIAARYPDQLCYNASEASASEPLMALPLWLNAWGGLTIAVILFGALVAAGAALLALFEIGEGLGSAALLVFLFVILVLYQIFNFCWNIVGAVALFRDSMACRETCAELWNMVFAVLIIQWISVLCSWFFRHAKKNKEALNA